jgi:hypothetical protein
MKITVEIDLEEIKKDCIKELGGRFQKDEDAKFMQEQFLKYWEAEPSDYESNADYFAVNGILQGFFDWFEMKIY